MKKVLLGFMINALVFGSTISVHAQSGDINHITAGSDSHTTWMSSLKTADLLGTLKGAGPFTIFAPTNEAFNKLTAGTLETWVKPENNPVLTRILIYHVLIGTFDAATINKAIFDNGGKAILPTISGGRLIATTENGKIKLTDENGGSAFITASDLKASNGIIHFTDAVLLPK